MMQQSSLRWLLSGGVLFYLLTSHPTAAQIVPDTTLPNNSIVSPNCTACQITGGTPVGNNLFHSFERFSIPTGGTAYFNNAATIENIISRVTGQSVSNIDGLLRANNANLFLLNPNGIIFGPNASLNIGGSFLATTADSLLFDNNFAFSASNPQPPPLLTINVPVGLGFGETPGSIVNQSGLLDSDSNPVGLQVPSGQTLALVGGEVALEGGFLTTPGGRIEVGSVAANSLVSLVPINQSWGLDYEDTQNFQDISLSQAAFIGSSNFRGADIQIQGRRITITQGSQVSSQVDSVTQDQAGSLKVGASQSVELVGAPADFFPTGLFNDVGGKATGAGRTLTIKTGKLIVQGGAQVSTGTFGTGQGVDLQVNASESVELVGNSPSFDLPSGLFARVRGRATGNGGTLTLKTKRLIVQDGAQVSTDTFGSGRAGDLQISASESVELVGRTPNNQPSVVSTSTQDEPEAPGLPPPSGNAGNLTIETGRLLVQGGAQVSTFARGDGQGGTLTINAADSILLSGTGPIPDEKGRSGVFVSAEPGANSDAGELKLDTRQLTVEDGARISADNFGTGQGGAATLNVDQLLIRGGGQVRAGSFGAGPGGTLTVNASEFVEVSGSRTIGVTTVPSELFTEAQASGDAGNLNITTGNLSVQDGARVTVSSQGSGEAGELNVKARSTELDQGALTATTLSGDGGNIILQAEDLLLLSRNSQISTQAGTKETDGTGGSITINTDNLVALENSDIDADAFGGLGGQVRINAQGIFGTEAREQQTPESDITASSDLGPQFSGTVEINTPDVDPAQGLANLPTEPINTEIAQDCQTDGGKGTSRFISSGSGGLPTNPYEPLDSSDILADVQPPLSWRSNLTGAASASTSPKPPDRIVEAQGWNTNETGEVVLVAEVPHDSSSRGCRLR